MLRSGRLSMVSTAISVPIKSTLTLRLRRRPVRKGCAFPSHGFS
jgi:hypothetical protein